MTIADHFKSFTKLHSHSTSHSVPNKCHKSTVYTHHSRVSTLTTTIIVNGQPQIHLECALIIDCGHWPFTSSEAIKAHCGQIRAACCLLPAAVRNLSTAARFARTLTFRCGHLHTQRRRGRIVYGISAQLEATAVQPLQPVPVSVSVSVSGPGQDARADRSSQLAARCVW